MRLIRTRAAIMLTQTLSLQRQKQMQTCICLHVCTKTDVLKTSFGTHVFWQVGAFRVNIVPIEKRKTEWESMHWGAIEGDRSSAGNTTGITDSKSVTGPSSLSLAISPEALDISLPGITGSQASSIKLTLNGLIGTHTIVSARVHLRKRRGETEKYCASE